MISVKQGTYRFDEFELNLDLRVLARHGLKVPVGTKAYELLACLVASAGTSVSKADLLSAVWPGAYVEDGTLTQHIFSLRKALGDKAHLIATVPGHGYRFAGVAWLETQPVPPSPVPVPGGSFLHELHERTHVVIEEPMPLAHVPVRSRQRVRAYAIAGAGVVLAAAAGGWAWSRQAVPRDHVTVVLSDFANMTGDATFDRSMGRALQIELEQSPYVDMMGDREGSATLKMMGRPNDTPLSAEVAREICVRTNRQVLLAGAISMVGGRYLLTLESTDCNSGKRLTSAKAEAKGKGDVLAALDSISSRVRSKLGESAGSIQAYDVPVSQATTSSLEALKVYSTVTYLTGHGAGLKDQDRLPFYKKAVELDPQFALAYLGIANCYYQLLEPNVASTYLQKAFDLRDRVTAKEKLVIEAHYFSGGLGADMLKSLETYRVWATLYPREVTPWTNMTNLYNELGRFPEAIAAGQKAYAMDPSGIDAALLIRAYFYDSRFADARALFAERQRAGKEASGWNDTILILAFREQDKALFDHEVQLAKENKQDLLNYHQAIPAAVEGKYKTALEFFAAEVREDEQANLTEVKDGVLVDQAEIERDYGLPAQARATLARMTKGALDMPDVAYEHAAEGDVAWAERYLAAHGNDPHPAGSYLGYMWFPMLRSELALRRGQPQEALTALDPTKGYELKGSQIRVQRAKVYVALHQPDKAAELYRSILATPGSDFGISYPMAHLWLAHVLATQGDVVGSRSEYGAFLAAMQAGDQDLPVLKAARTELARLK